VKSVNHADTKRDEEYGVKYARCVYFVRKTM